MYKYTLINSYSNIVKHVYFVLMCHSFPQLIILPIYRPTNNAFLLTIPMDNDQLKYPNSSQKDYPVSNDNRDFYLLVIFFHIVLFSEIIQCSLI